MKQVVLRLIFFFLCALLVGGVVTRVSAQNPACSSSTCVWVWCDYLADTYCPGLYPDYTPYVCGTNWVRRECCTIPQSGGGSCVCCTDGGGCYLDCPGITPIPTGGGPTPDPPPEGSTPTPIPTPTPTPVPGTVRMRAVSVPSSTTTCAQADSSTSYIASNITLFPPGFSNTTPVDGSYATWNNQPVIPPYTTYSFTDTPPVDYVLKIACWSRDAPGASSQGYAADLYSGSTLTWQLGYTNGVGWWQAKGGDVYAASALRSYIPASTSPRYAVLEGSSGMPGVVMYGTTYDFDSGALGTGEAYVSSKGWLANETTSRTDYYAVMEHRFDSPAADYTGDTTLTSKLASRATAYYVNGNLTISSTDWSVTDGENIVVLVSGNLTINRKINLTGTGFAAFIVKGNITVDPAVGVPYTSSVPVVEGVYITSPTGAFISGPSTVSGSERFVGEGIFIAGNFSLQRDLDSVGQNNTTASELFIYNPQLLITMPDAMKDMPITWQEVSP